MHFQTEMIESFFFDESESEYYSLIRKFSNPNLNIIRDFKKRFEHIRIFEKVRIFEYYSNNSVIFEHNVKNKKQKA